MTPLTDVQLAAIAEWLDDQQIFIPTSEARKLYDSHRALAAQLAAAQATIERLRTAMEAYADDRNWAPVTMYEEGDAIGDPQGDKHYYWERGGDGDPWTIAEDALAPPTPEADDAR